LGTGFGSTHLGCGLVCHARQGDKLAHHKLLARGDRGHLGRTPPAAAKARLLLAGGEVVMGMEVGRIGRCCKINKVEVLIISEGLRRPRVRASRCFYKTTHGILSFK